jgi:hypothetical protein
LAPGSLLPSTQVRKALPALFPCAVFAVLTTASWQRWIQPYVDTGRELMVPWRLSRGEALYRDVHFHHGPLAPYLAAAIDRAVGPSLPARTAFAFAVAIAGLEALRRIAARALPPTRAAVAMASAIATAVFLRPGGWLFPFSFDTALAAAGLTWLAWGCEEKRRAGTAAVAAGLFAALTSRVEIGVVGAAAAAWALRREPRRLAAALLPAAAAAAAFYASVSAGIPYRTLVRDGWLAVLHPPAAFQNVYRTYAGLDAPGLRLLELVLASVLALLAICALLLGAAVSRRATPASQAAGDVLAVILLAVPAILLLFPPPALQAAAWATPPIIRVLPPLVLVLAGWRALWIVRPSAGDPVPGVGDATVLVAAFFAARLLLAAGYVGPYDAFFLPLPIVVAAVAAWRGAGGWASAAGASLPRLVTLALVVFVLFRVATQVRDDRSSAWSRVETGVGSLMLREPVASATRAALRDLTSRLAPGSRMTGFPETGFFNYALGLPSATRYEQYFPGHQDAPAERELIGDLASRPPDAILVANVLAVGEHAPAFGRDYLAALDAFVRARFPLAAAWGPGAGPDPRIGDPQFFVAVRVPR